MFVEEIVEIGLYVATAKGLFRLTKIFDSSVALFQRAENRNHLLRRLVPTRDRRERE